MRLTLKVWRGSRDFPRDNSYGDGTVILVESVVRPTILRVDRGVKDSMLSQSFRGRPQLVARRRLTGMIYVSQ